MAKRKKKIFEIDLKDIEEMQDAIFEYFYIVSELLESQDIQVEKITLKCDSTKITVEGSEREQADSEESTEDEFEWI